MRERRGIELLRGAYDIHIHAGPDIIQRAQDMVQVFLSAQDAGMAGIGIKDHTTSTTGAAYVLNRLFPEGPRVISSVVLNPTIGSLNPAAVEAALKEGTDMIYFPTLSARHHFSTWGKPSHFPFPSPDDSGETVFDDQGKLKSSVRDIIPLIAQYNAILATGHLSPIESLSILHQAQQDGVQRMIVTHASASVPGMTIDQQKRAIQFGAWIEHSVSAVTSSIPIPTPWEEFIAQIKTVGAEHIILSSDLGQRQNPPPIQGFADYLDQMIESGISEQEIQRMIQTNPAELFHAK